MTNANMVVRVVVTVSGNAANADLYRVRNGVASSSPYSATRAGATPAEATERAINAVLNGFAERVGEPRESFTVEVVS